MKISAKKQVKLENPRLYLVLAFLSLAFLVLVLIIATRNINRKTLIPSGAEDLELKSSLSLSEPYSKDTLTYIDIYLNTFGNNVSGVDIKINYDSKNTKVENLAKAADSPFSSYPALIKDNTRGRVTIAANLGGGENVSPVNGENIKLATLAYTSKANNVPFQFNFTPGSRNDSNVVLMTTSSGEEPVDILTEVGLQKNLTAPTPKVSTVKNNTIVDTFISLLGRLWRK